MKNIKLAEMNPELVANEIGDFLVNRIAGIGFTGGVIGLSGGVDSTVAAALAKRAFDRYNAVNENKLELIGYALPSKTNSPKDEEDGVYVAEKLGICYEVRNIEPLVEAYGKVSPAVMGNLFNKGNLMSEMRATVLHGEAAREKKLVIGTGNRDEDFGVGYYTLFGDGAVHVSPIGNLPKRLVRDMATYLGFENLANRVPTAGLEPGQTDFGDLGYSYGFVELLSEGILQGFGGLELALHPQVKKMGNDEIAEYQKMYGKKKFDKVEAMVADFYKRNNIADAKAKIVSPAIADISLDYGRNK